MLDQGKLTPQKDFYDKAQKMGIAIFSVAVPALLTWYGLTREAQREKELHATRRTELLVEELSNRGRNEAAIKKDMFRDLMDEFLSANELQQKILVLKLLVHNFSGQHFQFEPLSESLYEQINQDSILNEQDKQRYKQEINEIATSLASREIGYIVGSGGDICEESLVINKPIKLEENGKCSATIPVALELLDFQENSFTVNVAHANQPGFRLNIGFFDTPLSNNIVVFDDNLNVDDTNKYAYSIVPLAIDESNAKVDTVVVVFPDSSSYRANNAGFFADKVMHDEFIRDSEDQGSKRY